MQTQNDPSGEPGLLAQVLIALAGLAAFYVLCVITLS